MTKAELADEKAAWARTLARLKECTALAENLRDQREGWTMTLKSQAKEIATERARVAVERERAALAEAIDIIRRVADEVSGGSVYEGYSGRGMYGAECWGISCDDATECIEAAAALGLRGACTDNLGRGYIVYWPAVAYTEAEGRAS